MREILFRGKQVNNGEWVEGYFAQPQGQRSDCADIYAWEKREFSDSIDLVRRVVNLDTVGEYTGLKDKNGVRIFEGDIIVINTKNNSGNINGYTGVVVFYQTCFQLQNIEDKEAYEVMWYLEEELEIIGNMYDNPELLEGIE